MEENVKEGGMGDEDHNEKDRVEGNGEDEL